MRSVQLGRAAYLTAIEDLLGHLFLQDLRRLCPLQHLVLTEGKKPLQDKLAQRKAHEDILPREEGAVEQTRQLL